MKRVIELRLLKEAESYFFAQSDKVQEKFLKLFDKTEMGFKGKWFEKMTSSDGTFEFKHSDYQKFYRILAFWDSNDEKTLILAMHGFDKKSNKTPAKEIKKAEQIKKDYFESKNMMK